MNDFTQSAIDQFLDRKAVSDLLAEYNSEEIYIGGAEVFFAAEEMQPEVILPNCRWKSSFSSVVQ